MVTHSVWGVCAAGLLASIERKDMEDLDMEDHLSGRQRAFLKLSFRNVNELMEVRRELLPAVKRNTSRANVAAAYEDIHDDTRPPADLMDAIIDMREYDVPYYTRVSIDRDVRVGAWYVLARRACVCVCVCARVCVCLCVLLFTSNAPGFRVLPARRYKVTPMQGHVELERLTDMVVKASPRVLAFDIECTKSPLKFPDPRIDQIYMISYMLDTQGYLIINRQIVSEEIEDFEYTPKPEFKGPFTVFNVANEEQVRYCRVLWRFACGSGGWPVDWAAVFGFPAVDSPVFRPRHRSEAPDLRDLQRRLLRLALH